MQKSFYVVLAGAMVLSLVVGCSKGYVSQKTVDNMNITLKAERYPLIKGDNALSVNVADSSGKPVGDAMVIGALLYAGHARYGAHGIQYHGPGERQGIYINRQCPDGGRLEGRRYGNAAGETSGHCDVQCRCQVVCSQSQGECHE